MRQRAMIAMMLSCRPELLLADEATTALDVTVQAQILHLLKELKTKLHLSLLFITHNFGVIAVTCDRIAVMYAGRVIEIGSKTDIFDDTLHPYTQGLLGSIPKLDQDTMARLKSIPGLVPKLINPPSGCRFHDRCAQKTAKCKSRTPELIEVEKNHFVACHLYT